MTVDLNDIPPVPTWDDAGATIDMEPFDGVLSNVLEHWGIDIDWSANETAQTVDANIGTGEAVEYAEVYALLRDVAFAAYHAGLDDARFTAGESVTERAPKTPTLILSWHEPDSCGGFAWLPDTAENRANLLIDARRDAQDYRDVILLACRLNTAGLTQQGITDMLDADLVFESGQVGEILYRSPRFEGEAS